MSLFDISKIAAMSAIGAATGVAGSFGYKIVTNQGSTKKESKIEGQIKSLEEENKNLEAEKDELDMKQNKLNEGIKKIEANEKAPKDFEELCVEMTLAGGYKETDRESLNKAIKGYLPKSTFNANDNKCKYVGGTKHSKIKNSLKAKNKTTRDYVINKNLRDQVKKEVGLI
ncbi:hypothetical protein [Candidatus Mycoplasma haematohominis]|uniref:Uncharacterized protein n=1 Tax=Candidatus Mycoplasma haematohominis TaxID=1494318 RepID=A0A478FU13_9MOLU|nr:hypothetical protein [Candidatus Mycoplasma haemohominis]GCE63919.1 hypothetical protein MHSWG343_09260 [Candidatus Mycoplasma haemohominis]